MELCVDSDIRGVLQIGDRKSDLGAVTAVYLRPYDWRRLPEIEKAGPGSPAWRHTLEVQDTLLCWLELTSAQVINRLTAMAVNNSKPLHACLIRSLGFDIPDTLITTDPSTAQEFWEKHGTVIYRSISSVRSIVSRLTPKHVRRLDDIAWCPTQFQRYIPGNDYRVHVVGDEVFACRKSSRKQTTTGMPLDKVGMLTSAHIIFRGIVPNPVRSSLQPWKSGGWHRFAPYPGTPRHRATGIRPYHDTRTRFLRK